MGREALRATMAGVVDASAVTLDALPIWVAEAAFWLAAGGCLALTATAIGVWTLVSRMRELCEEEKRLSILGEIQDSLTRLVSTREDLDLRRVEHLLIDMRDGLKRLEERMLAVQSPALPASVTGDTLIPAPPLHLSERITNRLLAQGFGEVQILLSEDRLKELLQLDGEVAVEARRGGVLHKGRVPIRGGRIESVEMNPAYTVFP